MPVTAYEPLLIAYGAGDGSEPALQFRIWLECPLCKAQEQVQEFWSYAARLTAAEPVHDKVEWAVRSVTRYGSNGDRAFYCQTCGVGFAPTPLEVATVIEEATPVVAERLPGILSKAGATPKSRDRRAPGPDDYDFQVPGYEVPKGTEVSFGKKHLAVA